jgi:dephospho-CoA kinase
MIIGITGCIGSGKSSVAGYWSMMFRLKLLNLDEVCRRLLIKEKPGWLAIKDEFGDKRFFTNTGELDRKKFRRAIFADSALRGRVDRCLHPLVKMEMINTCKKNSNTVWLVEIPLLFEAGWQGEVDVIVVVSADISTRVARVVGRDGVSAGEAIEAVKAQESMDEKVRKADFVIKNEGTWLNTCRQILSFGRLINRKSKHLKKKLDSTPANK